MTNERDPITGMTEDEYGQLADDLYEHRHELGGEVVESTVDPAVRSVVSVRFNQGELKRVEEAARASGLPISTYIRNAALAAAISVDIDAARRDLDAMFKQLRLLQRHLGDAA
jgi:predicted DNA binding CopG/RHH family protein